jgi:hypothetical protein
MLTGQRPSDDQSLIGTGTVTDRTSKHARPVTATILYPSRENGTSYIPQNYKGKMYYGSQIKCPGKEQRVHFSSSN